MLLNSELLFQKRKFFSGKMNREIELDTYERGDKTIIMTRSLIEFFGTIKDEYGIQVTKTTESVSFAPNSGLPVYCLCKCRIEDKNGYLDEEYGETLPNTRLSEIEANNPFVMADNRATSRGIIQYLRLPGKIYSSDEISLESQEASKEDAQTIIEKLGMKVAEERAEKQKEQDRKTVAKQEEQHVPSEFAPETISTGTSGDESGTAIPTNDEEENLIVFFGPGKGKTVTVKEAFSDSSFEKFIANICDGRVKIPENDPEKAAVVIAIKNYAKKIGMKAQ